MFSKLEAALFAGTLATLFAAGRLLSSLGLPWWVALPVLSLPLIVAPWVGALSGRGFQTRRAIKDVVQMAPALLVVAMLVALWPGLFSETSFVVALALFSLALLTWLVLRDRQVGGRAD